MCSSAVMEMSQQQHLGSVCRVVPDDCPMAALRLRLTREHVQTIEASQPRERPSFAELQTAVAVADLFRSVGGTLAGAMLADDALTFEAFPLDELGSARDEVLRQRTVRAAMHDDYRRFALRIEELLGTVRVRRTRPGLRRASRVARNRPGVRVRVTS